MPACPLSSLEAAQAWAARRLLPCCLQSLQQASALLQVARKQLPLSRQMLEDLPPVVPTACRTQRAPAPPLISCRRASPSSTWLRLSAACAAQAEVPAPIPGTPQGISGPGWARKAWSSFFGASAQLPGKVALEPPRMPAMQHGCPPHVLAGPLPFKGTRVRVSLVQLEPYHTMATPCVACLGLVLCGCVRHSLPKLRRCCHPQTWWLGACFWPPTAHDIQVYESISESSTAGARLDTTVRQHGASSSSAVSPPSPASSAGEVTDLLVPMPYRLASNSASDSIHAHLSVSSLVSAEPRPCMQASAGPPHLPLLRLDLLSMTTPNEAPSQQQQQQRQQHGPGLSHSSGAPADAPQPRARLPGKHVPAHGPSAAASSPAPAPAARQAARSQDSGQEQHNPNASACAAPTKEATAAGGGSGRVTDREPGRRRSVMPLRRAVEATPGQDVAAAAGSHTARAHPGVRQDMEAGRTQGCMTERGPRRRHSVMPLR